MKSPRPVLAIGASLFVLAAASLLDVARMQPQQAAFAKGDRQDVALNDCSGNSLMAACAGNRQASATGFKPITLIQVFNHKPAETTLVQVKVAN